jgi:hypothetical protein
VSEEAYQLLDGLRGAGKIEYWRTDFLPYLIDGITLTLPIAKKQRDYVKLHWLPVVINHGPSWDWRKV